MREHTKKPESQSRTLDSNPQASRQAPIDVILQRYKERNIQRYAEDEELVQGKFESNPITEQEPIQQEERPNNTGLPDNLKTGIENLSGYSMDDVKVHYNSDKPAQLQALAYIQGTDIRVALGQEKHLPHKAWHVVQQMQGRVKPTMQIQGVNVNENEGLEKEADVMGRKANITQERQYKTIKNTDSPIIQKYSIKKDLKSNKLYQVSDDSNIITSLSTPNHELYVNDLSYFIQIQEKIKSPESSVGFFPQKQVGFRFDPNILPEKLYWNVYVKYHEKVKNDPSKLIEHVKSRYNEKITDAPIDEDIPSVIDSINRLRDISGQIRKIAIYNKINFEHSIEDLIHFFKAIDTVLDSTQTSEEDRRKLLELPQIPKTLAEPLHNLTDEIRNLCSYIVINLKNKGPVNMLSIQKAAFNKNLLEHLNSENPFTIYRACDVVAATLNKSKEHKSYNFNDTSSGRHHFALEILSSGNDWVTMEGFAANGIEEERIGRKDDGFINLDHSWEYLMYGQLNKTDIAENNKIDFFKEYTENRYKFKNLSSMPSAGKSNPSSFCNKINDSELAKLNPV